MSAPQDDRKRIPALDGLRGCAVLMVVAGHALRPQHETLGAVGVTLFFVLSGYLITGILLADSAAHKGLAKFYLRRARRLLPALMLLLIFDAAARVITHETLAPTWTALAYVTNFAAASGHSSSLTHTWSLALEEQFYLIWPLLLPWLRRSRAACLWVLVAAATSAISRVVLYATGSWTVAYFNPISRADAILLGCALALAADVGWRPPFAKWLAPMGAVLMTASLLSPSRTAAVLMISPAAVGAAGVVAGVVGIGNSRMAGALSWPPIRYLGMISYGIYLWHPWFVANMLDWSTGARLCAVLLGSVVVASASWYVVERPILRPSGSSTHRFRAQRPVRSARSATWGDTAGSSPSPSAR